MAQFSTYKNLELPTSPEHYNIGVFNKNAMVIDSELHKLDIKNQSQDELLATKESLDSETERASTKENQILANLTAETERAKTVENTLTSTLESEINRALTTEESIHTNLSELIFELTTRLNTLADSDDTTLDQLSEIVAYIKNNKSLIDSITTSKVNVSDIIDDLTTNSGDKPLSSKQGTILKGLITDLKALVEDKANIDSVLPAKEGVIERDVTVKTGKFPQLRLGRPDYGESVAIELLHGDVSENGRGIVLEAWRANEESSDVDFTIRNRINGKQLFHITSGERKIYDYKTGRLQEVAVKSDLENISAATNIETPTFDDSTNTYDTLNDANNAAEIASNAIKSKVSIFTTLSNIKKSFSAIIQGLKMLGTNVGMITGITSDLAGESETVAASIKAVSQLSGNLTNSEWVEVPYKDVITLKSPAAFSSAAYWANYCCKNINTVQLDLYIEISSNINGAAFGQIAEGYRPLHRIYIDSGSMSAFIDTGGRISGYVEAGSYKVHTMYAI